MTEKRIASIAALVAAIGILLLGVACLILALRRSDVEMPRWSSVSYTSGSPAHTMPVGHSQLSTNRLSSGRISTVLRSLKEEETNLFVGTNVSAMANTFATNEQIAALGLDPATVSNALLKAFSRAKLQGLVTNPAVDRAIQRLLEAAPAKEVNEQTRIISRHP